MKPSLAEFPLEIPCPGCGKEIKKTVGWFERKGNHCPYCRAALDSTQLRKKVGEVEKSLKRTIKREFERLSKAFK